MFTRTKRFLAAAAFTLASVAPAVADIVPPPEPTEARIGNPAIWTIAKPGGGTITMFGSVHLLPAALTWRTSAFEEALAKADVVVFETQIENMATAEVQAYLAQNSMNPPGVTLSTLLSADEKTTVETAATSIGVPFAMLEPYRPWLVAIQLGLGVLMKQGFDPNAGVDKIVEAEARAAGKALDYFETAIEQLSIFTEMPADDEKAFLVVGAAEIVKAPDAMQRLLNAWADGDVASIDTLMNAGLAAHADLGKKLLEDRNARWVDKITSSYMTNDKNYLIVVGAGHLAGDKSVQAMLRANGVTVEGP